MNMMNSTYSESMERRDCLIALYVSWTFVVTCQVNGQVDIWGHKVGHVDLVRPLTFLGHKICHTDHKGNADLWGHKIGHGDLL